MVADFFRYEFLQHALYAGLIVGLMAPLVGVFLVVRRLSLIAEALSHVTLSGIALGIFFQLPPFYTGISFAILGSLFVERMRRFYHTYQELAIPLLLSGGMALGVVLISAARGMNVDIVGYLFGNILAVEIQELLVMLLICIFVVWFVWLFYKALFALSFDEEYAIISGIPHRMVNFFFMVVVALVISAGIRVVGVLLVSALMTLPVATGLKIANSFRQLIWLSILFAEVSVILGLIMAYQLDLASGGTIVLVSLTLLLIVVASQRLKRFMIK